MANEKKDRGFGFTEFLDAIDLVQGLVLRLENLLQRFENAVKILEGKEEGGETKPEENR